jgi:hypothetical protein
MFLELLNTLAIVYAHSQIPTVYIISVQVFLLSLALPNHLCGLVVRVLGYGSRGPSSIPGTTRFSEKWWVWNGVHSAS